MNLYSSKQQREQEPKRDWSFAASITFFLLSLIAVAALTGCASSTLEKATAQCFALDGEPEFTTASGVEKFTCRRSTYTARASR